MRGARVVQQAVLEHLDAENLLVHVIWTPVMATDDYDAAVHAQSFVSDPRARHYWDADRSLGLAYTEFVTLPKGNDTLAWDIYFVYEPGARWADQAPVPDDWWHQLAFDSRYLADGSGLREALERMTEGS